jgi:hypothetical protein
MFLNVNISFYQRVFVGRAWCLLSTPKFEILVRLKVRPTTIHAGPLGE